MNQRISLLVTVLLSCVFSVAQTRYNLQQMQMPQLNRGVVALPISKDSVLVSWRYLEQDPMDITFQVLADGKKVANIPARHSTCITLPRQNRDVTYTVKPSTGKQSGSWTVAANSPQGYLDIPISKPKDQIGADGKTVTYIANDAAVADLDGDGMMEIVLKWDPSNSRDNSQSGITNNTYIDAYRLDASTQNAETKPLWRIDMGRNIRSGAHYTQMMVYDLDGDGSAEVVLKTADGTTDALGKIIGDANADWRVGVNEVDEAHYTANNYPRERFRGTGKKRGGFIKDGPEYLTVFNGRTGAAITTVDYVPERGDVRDWGDNYSNRSERYLACVAYLDGRKPSVIMCRGYYTRAVLAAWDFDGSKLTQRWVFDTNQPENRSYAGQGNHNLRVADIDGDGCDEITYGSCAIDNDGKPFYNTNLRHGDAMHLTSFKPLDDHLYVWDCHEETRCSEFRDAQTGQVLWTLPAKDDVGRCMAADINPNNPGLEMWSSHSGGIRDYQGNLIDSVAKIPVNFAVWWDGDLLREMLDHETVSKYIPGPQGGHCQPLISMTGCQFNNGTKSNPCMAADILGDWREEVLTRTADSNHLRLYISPMPTEYRFHTFLQDPVYLTSVIYQNVAYNQPTCVGFYFGAELAGSKRTFRGWEFK